MKHALRFRPRARADLAAIWDYTAARWGPGQADSYLRKIVERCEEAARNGRVGRDASAIRAGYRMIASGSHIVFYRIADDDGLDVVRILHGAMDLPRHL